VPPYNLQEAHKEYIVIIRAITSMCTTVRGIPVLSTSSFVRVLKPPTLNCGSWTLRSMSTDLRDPSFHWYLMCLTEYASVVIRRHNTMSHTHGTLQLIQT